MQLLATSEHTLPILKNFSQPSSLKMSHCYGFRTEVNGIKKNIVKLTQFSCKFIFSATIFFISDNIFSFLSSFFFIETIFMATFALRELTLFTFEYFKDTNARQDRTHRHKKAKE